LYIVTRQSVAFHNNYGHKKDDKDNFRSPARLIEFLQVRFQLILTFEVSHCCYFHIFQVNKLEITPDKVGSPCVSGNKWFQNDLVPMQ
jgi:hypothetical protein